MSRTRFVLVSNVFEQINVTQSDVTDSALIKMWITKITITIIVYFIVLIITKTTTRKCISKFASHILFPLFSKNHHFLKFRSVTSIWF